MGNQAASSFDPIPWLDGRFAARRKENVYAAAKSDQTYSITFIYAVSRLFPEHDSPRQYARDQRKSKLAIAPYGDDHLFVLRRGSFVKCHYEFARAVILARDHSPNGSAVHVDVQWGKKDADLRSLFMGSYANNLAVGRADNRIGLGRYFPFRIAEEIGHERSQYRHDEHRHNETKCPEGDTD